MPPNVVPESVNQPEIYYRENVSKSIELFGALNSLNCRKIVFSSSAAVYDVVDGFEVTEESRWRQVAPMLEQSI